MGDAVVEPSGLTTAGHVMSEQRRSRSREKAASAFWVGRGARRPVPVCVAFVGINVDLNCRKIRTLPGFVVASQDI